MNLAFALPILAALFQSASYLLDKVILDKQKISAETYLGISFPMIFFINLAMMIGLQTPISVDLFSNNAILLLLLSFVLGVTINVLYYRALEEDYLEEVQFAGIVSRMPVVIFAYIFFADERNIGLVFLSVIASLSIAWSYIEDGKINIKQKTLPFLFWMLIVPPIGSAISKVLLVTWNPITLEVVRSGMVALALNPLFFRSTKNLNLKSFSALLLTNILSSIGWVLLYFSYKMSGIVYTGLLFSIQPALVFFGSIIFLKEPFNWKKTISFAIIIASIALSEFIS